LQLTLALLEADANAIEEVNLAYENVKQVDCLDVSKEGAVAAVVFLTLICALELTSSCIIVLLYARCECRERLLLHLEPEKAATHYARRIGYCDSE